MGIGRITPVLLATIAVVLADYYIDNANTSVIYAMPATQSGQGWETFSVSTQSLLLNFSNSTGNYSIELDASHCYDENYALGTCRTTDGCFVQIPFTGSGIAIYVFNAGLSGMTASFSIDNGAPISSSINAPPAPTYQVSNVSLYNVQGLPFGSHTIKMSLLDWNGVATSMKFDYARVNETFVASPVKTSSTSSGSASHTSTQMPSQTSAESLASSHNVNVGSIIGEALGGLALLAVLITGVSYHLRRRKPVFEPMLTPESTFQVDPFPPEYDDSAAPYSISIPLVHRGSVSSQRPKTSASASVTIPPLVRSAILRDALAVEGGTPSAPSRSSQSNGSAPSSAVYELQRKRYPQSVDIKTRVRSGTLRSHGVDAGSSVPGHNTASLSNLTVEQAEVVERLHQTNVPVGTVVRVIEEFVSSNVGRKLLRERSVASTTAPPPSYQMRGDQ